MVDRFTNRDNILQADASGVYQLSDSEVLAIGAGGDLTFSSDGTAGYIDNAGAGLIGIGTGHVGAGALSVHIGYDGGGIFTKGKAIGHQDTPENATDTTTLSDAQMLTGILVATPTAAAAYTMRTGAELESALVGSVGAIAADDSFDLTIINLGDGSGEDITLTEPTSGITIVGDPVVGPLADVATEQAAQGTFRFVRGAADTFVAYRVS